MQKRTGHKREPGLGEAPARRKATPRPRPTPSVAKVAAPRDPRVRPKANDVVQGHADQVKRKVFSAKGGSVVFNINGGPFDVNTVAQWVAWAKDGAVLHYGG